ncbi:MAG: N-acetyl-gamma-glutamyl-phosphate reductase [Gammaproteobacteria bacterium]|nr:MAG: N-acetyl-gamma-glutamyl-phosphate reductase [Gammaproteobacteria bacterium]
MARVFIDGQAGTTGLQIHQRLKDRHDIELLRISEADRKDPRRRAQLLRDADVAILCLPDEAAKEAVALAGGHCRILDASTAHRLNSDWAYGLPELSPEQRSIIASADKVSNPGCYPQGFILMIRPLIESGLLAAELPLTMHALTGYSGGGRQMIEAYQALVEEQAEDWNTRAYGLGLDHKHVPEMQYYSGTRQAPIFTPSVGRFRQGMLLQVPLFSSQLLAKQCGGQPTRADVEDLLRTRYAEEPFVSVTALDEVAAFDGGYLSATSLNDSNRLEIMIFGNDAQIVLTARYDNLGKGAAGAAVQNLNLMIGAEEGTGLTDD